MLPKDIPHHRLHRTEPSLLVSGNPFKQLDEKAGQGSASGTLENPYMQELSLPGDYPQAHFSVHVPVPCPLCLNCSARELTLSQFVDTDK